MLGAVASAVIYRTDAMTKTQKWLARRWPMFAIAGGHTESPRRSGSELLLWLVVGVVAAYSHLLMDILFSIGKDLPVWGVPLFWPFSGATFAYPMVRWATLARP